MLYVAPQLAVKPLRRGDWANCQIAANGTPLVKGGGGLRGKTHPGDGRQESLLTQYTILRLPAFCLMSMAVMTRVPPASSAGMAEQYTPA